MRESCSVLFCSLPLGSQTARGLGVTAAPTVTHGTLKLHREENLPHRSGNLWSQEMGWIPGTSGPATGTTMNSTLYNGVAEVPAL